MSDPSAPPSSASPDPDRLRRELEAQVLLVQSVRKELILSQITVLELQDTILQKETDKADAIAILGRLELALEEKINYIFELDRTLTAKLAALEQARAADQATHQQVTQDLVQKLDVANREIGATHTMAAGYARDLAAAREALQRAEQELRGTRADLDGTRTALAQTRTELGASQEAHRKTEAARGALAAELATVHAALSWRLTRPFRALRRLLP